MRSQYDSSNERYQGRNCPCKYQYYILSPEVRAQTGYHIGDFLQEAMDLSNRRV